MHTAAAHPRAARLTATHLHQVAQPLVRHGVALGVWVWVWVWMCGCVGVGVGVWVWVWVCGWCGCG